MKSGKNETTVLDFSHLSGFTGGDPEFESQILDIFLDNAPSYLELLSEVQADGWQVTAHKLKGAARSIGAWRLASAAEKAEKMGSPATDDPRRQKIKKILVERFAELVGTITNHQQALRAKPL